MENLSILFSDLRLNDGPRYFGEDFDVEALRASFSRLYIAEMPAHGICFGRYHIWVNVYTRCAGRVFRRPPAVTGLPSSPLVLIPNVALRSAILNWCERLGLPHPSPLSLDTAGDIIPRLMPPRQEQQSQLSHGLPP
ncbi:U-box domain-containing protein 39 [Hordeum vulgare]|nr:U-box domain-containing protein 39 [Hordeum vulgare]